MCYKPFSTDRSPVELDVVVSGEREDHARHRRLLPLAHEVEVQHALRKVDETNKRCEHGYALPENISLYAAGRATPEILVSPLNDK